MRIQRLEVGKLKANCYLVFEEGKREAIIIDPGDEPELIINRISELEIKPKYIIATHGHFDHLTAVNELKAAFKIPFLMHQADEELLKWMRKSAIYFTNADPGPSPTIDKYLGRKLSIFKHQFSVIETPGHTPGGVCFYNKKEGILFSGDTIFAGGMTGRWDFPYSNKAQLMKSVTKLIKLPSDTMVYPGHGEKTTIGKERRLLRQRMQ